MRCVILLLAVACSGPPAPAPICEPQQQIACDCFGGLGGRRGVRTCSADGLSYGPCLSCTSGTAGGGTAGGAAGGATAGGATAGGATAGGATAGGATAGGATAGGATAGGATAGGATAGGATAGGATAGGSVADAGPDPCGPSLPGASDDAGTCLVSEWCSDGGRRTCGEAQQVGCTPAVVNLAADDQHVAWLDIAGGVWAAPKGGAAVKLASGQTGGSRVAVKSGQVYWTTRNGIIRAPAAGGAALPVRCEADIGVIAADAPGVYYSGLLAGDVFFAPLDGGAPHGVANASAVSSLACDDQNVYWANPQTGRVRSAPLNVAGMGMGTQLFMGQASLAGLVVMGGRLYWVEQGSPGTARSGDVSGGAVETLAANVDLPVRAVGDSDRAWWFAVGAGAGGAETGFQSRPRDGGAAELELDARLRDLASDSDTLYLGTSGGVWRLPKQ